MPPNLPGELPEDSLETVARDVSAPRREMELRYRSIGWSVGTFFGAHLMRTACKYLLDYDPFSDLTILIFCLGLLLGPGPLSQFLGKLAGKVSKGT